MNAIIRIGRRGLVWLVPVLWTWAAGAATPDGATAQTYAPEREVHILDLALDVTPDFQQRTITASATLRFKPVAIALRELHLDAVDLAITNLTATEKVQGWQVTTNQVIITFEQAIPVDREASVTLRYHAQPSQGLYFRTPELGYRAEDTHLFSQGESILARHWYPCFDAPNDKFTSEITCRVPEGMVVLSNGRKISEEPAHGLVAVRWRQDKPHANYLLSLVAGHFRKLEDQHRDIPMAFWTIPSESAYATTTFRDACPAMAFFEREIGVPYPWAKYDQVCVQDFVAGGMENTSLTTLTDSTLYGEEFENTRNSQGLISHELAHQWFGDLVTCKDWSHLWLNEGFATFYEELFDGHMRGKDEAVYRSWLGRQALTGNPGENRAMVHRKFKNPDEQFNQLNYGKGAWVLHMLRAQLGEELYRRCVKTYLERHAFGNVVTEDFSGVVEELSGRSFDQFFDQWVYRGGYPQIEVDYAWDEPTRTAKLSARQTQPVTETQPLFRLPLPVRFKSKSGAVDRQMLVARPTEDFTFPLSEKPDLVLVDPLVTVLAKVTFKPSGPMLDAQLGDGVEVAGRLLAIEPLAARKDHAALALLRNTLNQDPFYAVRLEASKALRGIHTDEALEALLASVSQKDARVRRQVVADLGGFYRERVLDHFLKVIREEKNPDILLEAIVRLGAYPRPEVKGILTNLLFSHSFQNMLAGGAIVSMRAQDDPGFISPLLQALRSREPDFTAQGFAGALEALAWLARRQDHKDEVRELLTRHTSHPRKAIQQAALRALGVLEDAKALPVLQTFATAAKEAPERTTAEQAMEAIRASRKPSAELGGVRRELLDLQRENRTLRTELDAFKKQVETKLQTQPATHAPTPAQPALRAKPVRP